MFGYLLTGLSLGFYAALSPGPFQAFLLSQSLQNGWKRTLPASLAPLLSDGPIVALVLLVLTQTPVWFLIGLRISGGIFILYLSKGAFSTAQTLNAVVPVPAAHSMRQSLFKAALMNGLNPNPYIFWGVVAGPILLEGWRQAPQLGLSFVLGFYGTLIGGFAALIVVFATTRHLGQRATRALGIVSAAALALFGVYQIWVGITRLG